MKRRNIINSKRKTDLKEQCYHFSLAINNRNIQYAGQWHFKIKKSKVLSFDLQFCVLTFDF
ncbi:MAG: hypothetical protein A3B89_03715 [Candidatus Buchananbacteria bacterium RIFCSPHIGHO2_02_FULL_40_13]|nr:MAG: hypothetical protein A2820_01740 [Candidatus Buchananbacteria bacterium RIFCSPHIGHO2_01_FULL_40_35]OGY50311.1 MAG: hypothetical protein A3B89_03715 [Candidatus Buchananbacteria bacterium RIFCSPHIGHO2_02_FULL_40_13]